MVAVLDVGNTRIHLGIYSGQTLRRKWDFPAEKKLPVSKLKAVLVDKRVEGLSVASVVPPLTRQIVNLSKQHKLPIIVVSAKIDCGIQFAYKDPTTLGADRIAVIVGALSRYRRSVIVVDAGTAITIDVASSDGRHLGGLILPGMDALAEIMHAKTAQLPEVHVRKPRNLAGRTTEECIRSGIFNGTMMMGSGLIRALRKRYGREFYCVSTGGSGSLMARYINEIEKYDADLCLYGALTIYYRNVSN
jgi:type III pantothenate kinase